MDNHQAKGQILSFKESLLAMLGISFVSMLVALDQTVVGTALPTIVAELGDFHLYAWVVTSYLLSTVITIPLFGRLGDLYGRRPFLIVAIVLFTTSSVLCGVSNSMLLLVLMRVLQGVAGGMLIGTVFASIPDLFPDPVVRLRWQILMSAIFGIANAIGPFLGGFLTQYWGWRYVFYVNLPVGVVSLYFVLRFLPNFRHSDVKQSIKIDWFGALLLAAVLILLQFWIETISKSNFIWQRIAISALIVALGVMLYFQEKRSEHAILPLSVFSDRAQSSLFVISFFVGFVMFGVLFYLPLMLQGGLSISPKDAGVLITPMVAFITVGSIVNGRIVTRFKNANYMLYIGFALLAISLTAIIFFTNLGHRGVFVATMVLCGISFGLLLPNITVFVQHIAGRQNLGIATALTQSLRMIGGMIGTAVCGVIVTQFYQSHLQSILRFHQSADWQRKIIDPKVLFDQQDKQSLITELAHAGVDQSHHLIEKAQSVLISAVHWSFGVAVLVAVLGLIFVKRIPPIHISSKEANHHMPEH